MLALGASFVESGPALAEIGRILLVVGAVLTALTALTFWVMRRLQ